MIYKIFDVSMYHLFDEIIKEFNCDTPTSTKGEPKGIRGTPAQLSPGLKTIQIELNDTYQILQVIMKKSRFIT